MRSSPGRLPALVLPCALSLLAPVGACSGTVTPSVDIAVSSAAPPTATPSAAAPPTRPAGPFVLFAREENVLAPVVCHDGKEVVPADSPECLSLAPEGAAVTLDTGAGATLGPVVEVPCRGSLLNTFEGRKVGALDLERSEYAMWPPAASSALLRPQWAIVATDEDHAALTGLLLQEAGDFFKKPPKFDIVSGLALDMDGDGAQDRAFAMFEHSGLYGVVAVFLAKAPTEAVKLTVQQYHLPRLAGITELDGKPGHELLVSAEFVEGIEDRNVTSAISVSVLALPSAGEEQRVLGTWGCRMF